MFVVVVVVVVEGEVETRSEGSRKWLVVFRAGQIV